MRCSDRRLTDQFCLDTSWVPFQETMRSIGDNAKWTQKWTEIFGEYRQILTRFFQRWESLTDEIKSAVLRLES